MIHAWPKSEYEYEYELYFILHSSQLSFTHCVCICNVSFVHITKAYVRYYNTLISAVALQYTIARYCASVIRLATRLAGFSMVLSMHAF